jgi:hypothetical protein
MPHEPFKPSPEAAAAMLGDAITKDEPAFPCTTGSDGGIFQAGMTIRTYLAAKAMQGMLADPNVAPNKETITDFVNDCWMIADAMIEAGKR